jgi:hypothetical protein
MNGWVGYKLVGLYFRAREELDFYPACCWMNSWIDFAKGDAVLED